MRTCKLLFHSVIFNQFRLKISDNMSTKRQRTHMELGHIIDNLKDVVSQRQAIKGFYDKDVAYA